MPELLQHWLDRAAERRPEAPAVVGEDLVYNYGWLATLSNRIAHTLRERGCARGDRVCLLMPKSPMAIAAILGIYKAGCVYVPLGPDNPAVRLAKIIRSCECRALLVAAELGDKVAALRERLAPEPLPLCGWLDTEEGGICLSDRDFTLVAVDEADGSALPSHGGSNDPAHILYTSGSTGEPKGVVITHANVIAFIDWAQNYFGLGPDDRLSAHSPLHFDLSLFDIFGTLAAQAQLHLVGSQASLLPHKLAQWMRVVQLTHWFSVPSVLNYLCKFDAVRLHDFPALRRVLWCGEVLPTPALRYWMKRLPHVSFTNLYGPTETTIASSYYTVPHCPVDDQQPIPIGRPCAGEELLVLDERLRVKAPDETGDLYIRGIGLARGYWNDPLKTATSFLPNPGLDADPGLLYKTGDLARIGRDGLVYFLGRADEQIKSRGYRIELGEIEAALCTLSYLREAAVVALPGDNFTGVTLSCAYVLQEGAQTNIVELRSDLATLLPLYMIPSQWKAVSCLPRTSNGKVDRRMVRSLFELDELPASRQA